MSGRIGAPARTGAARIGTGAFSQAPFSGCSFISRFSPQKGAAETRRRVSVCVSVETQ